MGLSSLSHNSLVKTYLKVPVDVTVFYSAAELIGSTGCSCSVGAGGVGGGGTQLFFIDVL